MAEVFVLVEHQNGAVKKVTLELLTLARSIGEPSAVFVGAGADSAVATLAENGAENVYVADSEEVTKHPIGGVADVLAQLAGEKSPAAILIPSSPSGNEIAGRLAIKIDSGVITDAVGIDAGLVSTLSIFGGELIVNAKVSLGTPIFTVRPNSIAPEATAGAGNRVDVSANVSEGSVKATVVDSVKEEQGARPDLAEASVVVSGGRGVGGAEGFGIVEELADSLGGAVGASRAATDAGWYPHQYQVGQTGKTVSPQVYIANGISGAIQHRAGMQTSKTIVVVNKDPEAPIFELADFGVVGDLFNVVPQLTAEVKSRKG